MLKLKEKIIFGGGESALHSRIASLDKQKIKYILEIKGSLTILDDGVKKTKFATKKLTKESASIMQCCKEVKADAKRFMDNTPLLETLIGEYKLVGSNPQYFKKYIKENKKEIASVDINHCYFRIAYLFNIITAKTYDKWKDLRDERLTAIGCLNTSTTYDIIENGARTGTGKKDNELFKVWEYILYKTFKAVECACISCDNKYFSYHTDGIYLPLEYAEKAEKCLHSLNLPTKIVKYNVVGKKGAYTIIEDSETGETKQVNFGVI